MIEYPKIETLYNRDPKTHKVKVDEIRLQEFDSVRRWQVTEKIDGTNIRICFSQDGTITFGGRTDNAQIPPSLINYLKETFTPEKTCDTFKERDCDIMLFGEGYGEKIQNGGNYRSGVSFRLFDILIGRWWLEYESMHAIALNLGINTVPVAGMLFGELPKSIEDLKLILEHSGASATAIYDGGPGCMAEGIVARSWPLMLTRRGDRVMWKLKFKDF